MAKEWDSRYLVRQLHNTYVDDSSFALLVVKLVMLAKSKTQC